ncbi:MAG: hypothetical protein IJJ99_04325 [Oscillospiraceae bacterium]|nr:hypothetical protein [Oscillospiraceae bacterium]
MWGSTYTQMLQKTSWDFLHVTFIVGAVGAMSSETVPEIINSALFFIGSKDYNENNFSD